jgi:para-nitrobenzyl esterase
VGACQYRGLWRRSGPGTIWGESGGGSKVSNLLNMPAAKGLFHRAIVSSGSALTATDKATATANARRFLKALNIPENQLDMLQTTPVDDLVKAGAGIGWGPVIDGRNFTRDPFAPDASPLAAGIPMIIITDANEGTLFVGEDPATMQLTDAQLHDKVKTLMRVSDARADEVIAIMHKSWPMDSQADLYIQIVSERTRANAIAQAERKAKQGSEPAYMVFFKWETPVGAYKAFHTSDLPLEFRIVRYPESETLSKRISAAWASFARDGVPTIPGGPVWPAYELPTRTTAVFDLNAIRMASNPHPQDYQIWQIT